MMLIHTKNNASPFILRKRSKSDAEAHKKKRESLSPEDKDQFDKNNAAALNKHRKSLTPNQRGQEFKKMLPNTKNIQSLSLLKKKLKLSQSMQLPTKNNMNCLPQKKVRHVEIRAEQGHEHLTEEEEKISAQMRFVAATLYEKTDLDKPTVEFLREHFYKDPTLTLTYFYCCSTDPHVAIFDDELRPDVDKLVLWNHISNLIGSPIGQEEAMLCQETFHKLDQSHAKIVACASCCERLLSVDGKQGIVEMKIADLLSEFLATANLSFMLIVYLKGGIEHRCASPSSRHS
jgi:hypothetical protein